MFNKGRYQDGGHLTDFMIFLCGFAFSFRFWAKGGSTIQSPPSEIPHQIAPAPSYRPSLPLAVQIIVDPGFRTRVAIPVDPPAVDTAPPTEQPIPADPSPPTGQEVSAGPKTTPVLPAEETLHVALPDGNAFSDWRPVPEDTDSRIEKPWTYDDGPVCLTPCPDPPQGAQRLDDITLAPTETLLLYEKDGAMGLSLFKHLVSKGATGLAITRFSPPLIRDRFGLDEEPYLLWLTRAGIEEDAITIANTGLLMRVIKDFLAEMEDGVLLFEGADLIKDIYGSTATLELLQGLKKGVEGSRCLGLVSIRPQAFDKKELERLHDIFELSEDL